MKEEDIKIFPKYDKSCKEYEVQVMTYSFNTISRKINERSSYIFRRWKHWKYYKKYEGSCDGLKYARDNFSMTIFGEDTIIRRFRIVKLSQVSYI